MDVCIDATGSNNLSFARDHLGSWSDDYADVRLHIGIPGFADCGNASVLNRDIGFHNAPVIQNERVRDHRINCAITAGTLRLTHAVTDYFPTSELNLFAVDRDALLHLDYEASVCKSQLIA